MDYPIFIYNTLDTTLVFQDSGMEISPNGFYTISDKSSLDSLTSSTDFNAYINNGSIKLTKSELNVPILTSDILDDNLTKELLNPDIYAEEVIYKTSTGTSNLQDTVESIITIISTPSINIDGGKPNSKYGEFQHLNGGKP